jgi:hypothetical protein
MFKNWGRRENKKKRKEKKRKVALYRPIEGSLITSPLRSAAQMDICEN